MGRVSEIDSELRKPLSADSEERATDLEDQEVLEAIENSEMHEIHQIKEALKRISEGTYGICTQCGADINPKRLHAFADCDAMYFMRCVKRATVPGFLLAQTVMRPYVRSCR